MNLQSSPLLPLPIHHHTPTATHFCFLFPAKTNHHFFFSSPLSKHSLAAANSNSQEGSKLSSDLFDHDLLSRVSSALDAPEVLRLISEDRRTTAGLVSASDCRLIISAALHRGNADLALSVFSAMRSSFDSGPGWVENATSVERWRWSRPDVDTYTLLVNGLAALLRVSDALRIVDCVCRVGVSPGEEVPFGKVVKCPSCMIAVSVAQPQQGIQACAYNLNHIVNPSISIQWLWIQHYHFLQPLLSGSTFDHCRCFLMRVCTN